MIRAAKAARRPPASYQAAGPDAPLMTWTDEDLVARARGGDVESFNQLILRWERPIYALAYRVIGREEDARDVCQETFLRAFRALPGFKGQAKFSSWLYRIALNLCHDWVRRCRRTQSWQRFSAIRYSQDENFACPLNPGSARNARRNVS